MRVTKNSQIQKQNELERTINFIEELSWLMDTYKALDLKKLTETLRASTISAISTTNPTNKLIGCLPTLLKDESLFSSNSSLVEFAKEVLNLEISRWEKKSRNELIGRIICDVESANGDKIVSLTEVTEDLLRNKEYIKKLRNQASKSKNIFSWNETIREITGKNH